MTVEPQSIQYGRRTANLVFAYPVIVSTVEEEQRVRDWLMSPELGWKLLNVTDADGGKWQLNFTYTELVADTDRGDAVSYDRRYEVRAQ